jgi:hypothetical protein
MSTRQEDLERTLAAREIDWHQARLAATEARIKSDKAFEEYQKAQLALNVYLRVMINKITEEKSLNDAESTIVHRA